MKNILVYKRISDSFFSSPLNQIFSLLTGFTLQRPSACWTYRFCIDLFLHQRVFTSMGRVFWMFFYISHLTADVWFILRSGLQRQWHRHISAHHEAGVPLICKLANEALLYVRLPAPSLWCCLGLHTEDRDPWGKAEQVRWGILWPQGVWLFPSRSWKTPLSTEMFGFDCPVVTAGLGLISQVEMEWLCSSWLADSQHKVE